MVFTMEKLMKSREMGRGGGRLCLDHLDNASAQTLVDNVGYVVINFDDCFRKTFLSFRVTEI